METEKTYYDWLFTETEKEKEIQEKIRKETEAFEQTDAYKEHEKRIDELFEELKEESRKRREEAKKHRPSRELPKKKTKEEMDEFKRVQILKRKERLASYPEKLRNLIEGHDELNEDEKGAFARETQTYLEFYKDYENPQTTEEDIRELAEILVQTTIDFINERQLKDVDMVCFNADALQTSAEHGKWVCATDAFITLYGEQKEKGSDGKEFYVRKKIGQYM